MSEKVTEKMYILLDSNRKSYASGEKGTFGGNKKSKIYGRLDCPAALRSIARGQYVNNRVFFIDENMAIAAGYRPCAVCMSKEYALYKKRKSKKE